MSRHYDAAGLCRVAPAELTASTEPSCVLAPVPPEVDEPLVDPEALDRVEDRYLGRVER